MTDAGPLCRGAKCWFRGYNDPVPDPSVWFDFPRDTERETLTTDDLVWAVGAVDAMARRLDAEAHEYAPSAEYARQGREVSARLRAALDALTKQSPPDQSGG